MKHHWCVSIALFRIKTIWRVVPVLKMLGIRDQDRREEVWR